MLHVDDDDDDDEDGDEDDDEDGDEDDLDEDDDDEVGLSYLEKENLDVSLSFCWLCFWLFLCA